MSALFHANDRAYLMDATCTMLRPRQLYCVRSVYMNAHGVQSLSLVGWPPDDFYNASRFVRVADPTPRKWPTK